MSPREEYFRGGRNVRTAAGTAPILFKFFELIESLSPGGSAAACELDWNSETEEYELNEDTEFTVYDRVGRFAGRAAVETDIGDGILHGSRGYAMQPPTGEEFDIVALTPHAMAIQALTDGAVLETDSYISIDSLEILYPAGGLLLESLSQIKNTFDHVADDNSEVHAVWNQSQHPAASYKDEWECSQIKCPV